ncbi:MAG: response regulator transcription factor [Bauldia sp.]|nr:response regulator transcription factor [Bauldia sp.]
MNEAPATRRPAPITDPVRVVVIDPLVTSRHALGRAIDLDPHLAVVGLCADPRRAAGDIRRAAPDVVAIRLHIDESECTALLADIARSGRGPAVVVLGRASAQADAATLVARIKSVVALGRPDTADAPEPRGFLLHAPASQLLH